jgi:hypothetical protein
VIGAGPGKSAGEGNSRPSAAALVGPVPLQELVLGWQLQSQLTVLYFAVANAILVPVKLRHSH